MAGAYSIVDIDAVSEEQFPESGVSHAKLTEALGAMEMRVNKVALDPGEIVGYHTHESQEEIYVCVDGPGQVFVDGSLETVPDGGVVRFDPEVPRQVLNTTDDETHVWVMFGAPKVGTLEDFGEYQVAEGGYETQ